MRKDELKIGSRFERYIILSCEGKRHKQFAYKCLCDCGRERIVSGYHLFYGKAKSCGCLSYENRAKSNTSHGMTHTKIYQMWAGMNSRCRDKKHVGYKSYGGRGIQICDSWRNSFESFYADMKDGYKEGLTIDRIDNDGNYCKENCRWLTRQENYLNSSRIKHIEINGISKPLYEWLAIYRQSRGAYANRVYKYGWTPKRAITTPGTSCI